MDNYKQHVDILLALKNPYQKSKNLKKLKFLSKYDTIFTII